MGELTLLQKIAVSILPVLFGITVHEVAHGWVAKRLGDPTAQRLGRLTLNPLKHIDLLGTILVPAILLLSGARPFGWAKPVPVTWENLRHPKRDMVLVSIAGPLSNFLMAIFWGLLASMALLLPPGTEWFSAPLLNMGIVGIGVNGVLMLLNMLPIPPLDGGRVIAGLLPGRLSWQFGRIEPYGFFILFALLFIPINGRPLLDVILVPPLLLFAQFVTRIVGMPL